MPAGLFAFMPEGCAKNRHPRQACAECLHEGGRKVRGRIRVNIWPLAGAALGAVIPVILVLWPGLTGLRLTFPALWKYWIVSGALLVDAVCLWLLTRPPGARPEAKILFGGLMVLASLVGVGTFVVFGRILPPALAVFKEQPARAQVKPAQTQNNPPQKPKPTEQPPQPKEQPKQAPAAEEKKPGLSPEEQARLEASVAMDLLKRNCMGGCHNYDNLIGGSLAASDLKKLAEQRTMSYIIQLIRDPVNMGVRGMPKANLTDREVAIIAKFLSGRGGQKGQEKPWFGNFTLDMTSQEMIEAGKKKYQFFNCQSCHKIDKQGGDMGPDLTRIGAQREVAWIESFLTSPQAVKPGTMQPFLPMTVDEIKAIAAYLASLR